MSGTLSIDTLQNGAGASVPVTTVINGSAKAWVQFQGSNGAISGSFNVSSVTRASTGQYTINLAGDMGSTNYAVVGLASPANGDGLIYNCGNPKTSSSVNWKTWTAGVGYNDFFYNSIVVFA